MPEMVEHLAEDGTLITGTMIDSWGKEIENGFPNSIIDPMSAFMRDALVEKILKNKHERELAAA